MRRFMVLGLTIGLLAASFAMPAEAGKKKKKTERVVEWAYEAPAFGTPESGGVCFRPTMSCIDIPVGPGELYLTLEATDATGTPIAVEIGQDTDPATLGTEHDVGIVCGKTTEPLQLEPGAPIVGFPWASGGSECPGGIATQGTIKATLSNMP